MKTRILTGAGLSLACLIGLAIAQQGAPPAVGGLNDRPKPKRPPHRPPPHPVVVALDADQDGILSAEEIAGATDALLALDGDGDGALGGEELRPPRPTPPPDAEPGDHIMRLDANEDEIVTFEEFAAPAKDVFDRIDVDGNEQIERDEAAAAPPPPPPPPSPPHHRHHQGSGKPPAENPGPSPNGGRR